MTGGSAAPPAGTGGGPFLGPASPKPETSIPLSVALAEGLHKPDCPALILSTSKAIQVLVILLFRITSEI